ncbi:hypothetical protein C8R45DRAFT_1149218 [Mycena sanguinolenta]|nr:hypothetical protein C8R45DRAFT_1149218 [Mycena sanguinolenta]
MTCSFPIVGLVLLATVGCAFAAGPAPVLLGTAGNFAILAKTGVSSVPNSDVSGNVGVSPATITSVTGFSLTQDVSTQFWTSTQVDGRVMGSTDGLPTPALLTVAVLDMQTAFTDAMNRPNPNFVELKAGLIGGSILTPGLYKWTTAVSISTAITIAGGPADTWIFQISGTLTQAPNVHITLTGGALSHNIIWAVAGTVQVGANAVFEGNILAQTNVIMGTDAIDFGCIYSQTAVALLEAMVLCGGSTTLPPPPPSSSPGGSSTPPVSSSSAPSSSVPASSTPVSSTPVSSTAPPTSAPASSSPVITTSSTKQSFSRKYTTSTKPYNYYGY